MNPGDLVEAVGAALSEAAKTAGVLSLREVADRERKHKRLVVMDTFRLKSFLIKVNGMVSREECGKALDWLLEEMEDWGPGQDTWGNDDLTELYAEVKSLALSLAGLEVDSGTEED